MKFNKFSRNIIRGMKAFPFALATLFAAHSVNATIVQFETNLGNFEVNLYDQNTPQTVENFLNYVNSGSYSNTIIHRSVSNFIVQGGGFSYNSEWPLNNIAANAPVVNEPVYSNVRGTIAMAKIGGLPDSATNQWFFNLADNQANLDNQNGGFTVFGEVTGNGMAIIDQIAALEKYNLGGALTELPLQNYSADTSPDETQLVMIHNISILDSSANTAANLNPPLTTRTQESPNESSGGGTFGFIWLLVGILFTFRKSERI